jgi:hypothetical protein
LSVPIINVCVSKSAREVPKVADFMVFLLVRSGSFR